MHWKDATGDGAVVEDLGLLQDGTWSVEGEQDDPIGGDQPPVKPRPTPGKGDEGLEPSEA